MPRPDVSRKRRTEIVDAAARVFSRKGFSGARMDDIVREAGLSKGLLYWYFKPIFDTFKNDVLPLQGIRTCR